MERGSSVGSSSPWDGLGMVAVHSFSARISSRLRSGVLLITNDSNQHVGVSVLVNICGLQPLKTKATADYEYDYEHEYDFDYEHDYEHEW